MAEPIPGPWARSSRVDSRVGGGDDGGMEERLRALEQSVAVIKSNYATKEDLRALGEGFHKEMLTQTWRIIGAATLLTGAVYVIVRYVH